MEIKSDVMIKRKLLQGLVTYLVTVFLIGVPWQLVLILITSYVITEIIYEKFLK